MNRKINKCDKVIARGVRRSMSNKKRWANFNLVGYLNRKKCSPKHIKDYYAAQAAANESNTAQ